MQKWHPKSQPFVHGRPQKGPRSLAWLDPSKVAHFGAFPRRVSVDFGVHLQALGFWSKFWPNHHDWTSSDQSDLLLRPIRPPPPTDPTSSSAKSDLLLQPIRPPPPSNPTSSNLQNGPKWIREEVRRRRGGGRKGGKRRRSDQTEEEEVGSDGGGGGRIGRRRRSGGDFGPKK